MYKRRRRQRPTVPNSNEEITTSLREYVRFSRSSDDKVFYRTFQTLEDGSQNLIFVSESLLPLLDTCSEAHIDATFWSVPRGFYQLLTLHVMAYDHSLPVCYCLMTRKTAHAYTNVLQYLVQLAPNFSPSVFMADFEVGLHNALRVVFDESAVKGCLFHYGQALYKYMGRDDINLRRVYSHGSAAEKNVLRMCFPIPLLSSQRCADGLRCIRRRLNLVEGDTRLRATTSDIANVEFVELVPESSTFIEETQDS